MKKILIVNNNLETGGVQTSLLNLLKEIKDKYDTTLLLFKNKTEYRSLIPDNIKVATIRSSFKYFGVARKDVRGKLVVYVIRCFWALICKIFGRAFTTKCMSLTQKTIKGYDIAISFLHEHSQKCFYGGCNEFVLNCISAKEKIAWVHCDFRNNGANNNQSCKIYQGFDKIVACSESTKNAFLECFPQFSGKTFFMRNCNDYLNIKLLANEAISYDNTFFNLVTVARLTKEKGLERALYAVKYCIEKGISIKYHIVGEGAERAFLQSLVCNLGIENDVFFYGNQANPYVYIKNADLMLLTSYHEAAPMIFDESACLGVPVLTTRTTSVVEMIESQRYGIVCENEQESISKTLFDVCSNKNKIDDIKESLNKKEFDNKLALQQFEEIINRGVYNENC